nr:O-antigen ligase family protein [Thermoleophilaceae bacterium]
MNTPPAILQRLADSVAISSRLKRAGAAAIPFAAIMYLALKGGGYDTVVWGEIGIAAWWLLGLGVAVGALPVARLRARAWTAIALLAALAIWTGLSIGWSDSAERSATDLARTVTYLSVFCVALAAVAADMRKQVLAGVGAAIAAVVVLAVLSRIQPDWFSANETNRFLPEARERLSYPLNYWNALGAFAAMGLPLLLAFAASARTIPARAGAASLASVAGLCAYLTLSRGAVVAVAVALLLYLILVGRRPLKLLAALPALAGAGILIAAANQRPSLIDGVTSSRAGDEMLVYLVVVAAGVAFLHAAISLALVHGPELSFPTPTRRMTAALSGGIAALVLVAFLAAGGTGYVSERYDEFKGSGVGGAAAGTRLQSVSGNGRYQYWRSAIDAGDSKPLTGVGAGTFEFWWAENGDLPGFLRDAHSKLFETYAELGLPGILLFLALVAWLLFAGGSMALRSLGVERTWAAAAT